MPRIAACAGCAKRIQLGSTSLPPGEARCRECQRAEVVHGTVTMYRKRGCKCSERLAAAAATVREYVARRAAEGRPIKKARSKNRGNRYDLNRADRLAIYERDGWVCQLCSEPVERDLHWNDLMAATLDHIEPQSATLIPNHSPNNLRLAHRICNARRGARVESLAS